MHNPFIRVNGEGSFLVTSNFIVLGLLAGLLATFLMTHVGPFVTGQ
jgi:hypothetical protein